MIEKIFLGTALVLLLGCSRGIEERSKRSGVQSHITVECLASVTSSSITLKFVSGSERLRFLVGKGMPRYFDERILDEGTLVLTANFTCPLEYEHRCFHAETVILGPEQSKEMTLDWSTRGSLRDLNGKADVVCRYNTLEREPVRLFKM